MSEEKRIVEGSGKQQRTEANGGDLEALRGAIDGPQDRTPLVMSGIRPGAVGLGTLASSFMRPTFWRWSTASEHGVDLLWVPQGVACATSFATLPHVGSEPIANSYMRLPTRGIRGILRLTITEEESQGCAGDTSLAGKKNTAAIDDDQGLATVTATGTVNESATAIAIVCYMTDEHAVAPTRLAHGLPQQMVMGQPQQAA
uniref:Uncharacterized protein n=1 Tax=Amorphochlora amoebiformis TaxID=1561963 RepID=A0A7S0GTP1_9EUKA|mmetsp:Transcript_17070/g.27132  ORF Transcript_17070/g.27132 Transcript_17070/m.27132 type:complete len:201 (+) Transcript_17070:110-712(+)